MLDWKTNFRKWERKFFISKIGNNVSKMAKEESSVYIFRENWPRELALRSSVRGWICPECGFKMNKTTTKQSKRLANPIVTLKTLNLREKTALKMVRKLVENVCYSGIRVANAWTFKMRSCSHIHSNFNQKTDESK